MPTDRRTFLAASALATAGLLTESSRGFAANDTLQVGLIGTGGRCRQLVKSFGGLPNVKITAVCDVWDQNLAEGQKVADPKAFATKQYEELLARKDVDAVLIGSPDHWHVPLTIDACKAGKDVYVEKPLTHDLSEGRAVIAAQNETKRVVQVGTQQRSMTHILKAHELLKAGTIGKVHKVHCTWNRNAARAGRFKDGIDPKTVDWKRFLGTAKAQDFDPYRFRQWRWFWDFGGGIFTDLMVHWIDVVHWFLELDHPATAHSIGDFYSAKDVWETPDTVQTLLRYPDKDVQVYFEGTFSNNRNGSMLEFMGTEGTLYIDRGRYEVIPDRDKKKPEPSSLILGTDQRKGLDFYDKPDGELLHLLNWVECVRDRTKKVNCPVEAGVSSASAAHMANLSLRTGQVATWKA
ncbi:oxidoreductase domain-containing protein : Putative dehydrogenase OS=Singulisphaera acidiphila (strain ATCC BAA-1392 / DSM 18658 / VKM B-2454 / MOB10) GN=Sinac_2838 PE=4 SV=1: GFO_IDH_MocA: GFO_IDH_MocA_C [Gemmataceae bacterium]|nr:oxidoreductase domain-containing protein : Putative dehydrogenase OS=Singulisphaera acidiphila (strain ATCC BAA-1392 / DSM 18658 / VKM B-2454 / MOB10) GN=Sinac_2838 PE=4 SV=1: GFO_IDH_MocA: GFO_IDH_MocA_C [Gemmataceae bacterium]VTT98267.1 oxidoreductase domain-containing protein : Putative dehydrogenase OS=Singulisphaera acidiphila (strain ATCC BAA-1392 / DSM 18658 / VKM B-2454 / MOB10) GN=Sinac_2838 PE=4 SV=1: GFO_IDH_MocA: GFO_IDH_MocA_C [Gemmataceae bacterium]